MDATDGHSGRPVRHDVTLGRHPRGLICIGRRSPCRCEAPCPSNPVPLFPFQYGQPGLPISVLEGSPHGDFPPPHPAGPWLSQQLGGHSVLCCCSPRFQSHNCNSIQLAHQAQCQCCYHSHPPFGFLHALLRLFVLFTQMPHSKGRAPLCPSTGWAATCSLGASRPLHPCLLSRNRWPYRSPEEAD